MPVNPITNLGANVTPRSVRFNSAFSVPAPVNIDSNADGAWLAYAAADATKAADWRKVRSLFQWLGCNSSARCGMPESTYTLTGVADYHPEALIYPIVDFLGTLPGITEIQIDLGETVPPATWNATGAAAWRALVPDWDEAVWPKNPGIKTDGTKSSNWAAFVAARLAVYQDMVNKAYARAVAVRFFDKPGARIVFGMDNERGKNGAGGRDPGIVTAGTQTAANAALVSGGLPLQWSYVVADIFDQLVLPPGCVLRTTTLGGMFSGLSLAEEEAKVKAALDQWITSGGVGVKPTIFAFNNYMTFVSRHSPTDARQIEDTFLRAQYVMSYASTLSGLPHQFEIAEFGRTPVWGPADPVYFGTRLMADSEFRFRCAMRMLDLGVPISLFSAVDNTDVNATDMASFMMEDTFRYSSGAFVWGKRFGLAPDYTTAPDGQAWLTTNVESQANLQYY